MATLDDAPNAPMRASGTTTATTTGKLVEGGPSLAIVAGHTDNRSGFGTRAVSQGQRQSGAGQSVATRASHGPSADGFRDGTKARRGSIRNAVRKIFGRRNSRTASTQRSDASGPTYSNVPRHAYHKSESSALPPPQEEVEGPLPDGAFHAQTVEDRYQPLVVPTLQRTSSPYAVQFPNSVRLKPLALGHPQMTRPNELRRRQTLPSIIVAEQDAPPDAMPATERESTDAQRSTNGDLPRDVSTLSPKKIIRQVKKSRRRSRSADDLKSVIASEPEPPRKRSDEIRYWRQSYQPDVLRASGFVTKTQPRDTVIEEPDSFVLQQSPKSPRGEAAEARQESQRASPYAAEPRPGTAISRSGTLRSSPPRQYIHGPPPSEADNRPLSGAGTEMSKELEDRVAKLEAGLQTFQRSLQRLTAERNRRTIIMGSIDSRPPSTDMRTPSLLADTLVDDLEPSSYQYEYGQTLRPSTSSPPSATSHKISEDPFGPEPTHTTRTAATTDRAPEAFPLPPKEQVHPSPLNSHPPVQQQQQQQPPPLSVPAPAPAPPQTTTTPSKTTPTQPYTFSSLYQMLSDERSARRNLEAQLRNLQREIADLHTQVASYSPGDGPSARSSYMLHGGSSRLQDLLQETEGGAGAGPRVSRFSGSETTGSAMEEGGYEAFRTPREERSDYSLVSTARRGDEEVF